jgi:hypothetical protein
MRQRIGGWADENTQNKYVFCVVDCYSYIPVRFHPWSRRKLSSNEQRTLANAWSELDNQFCIEAQQTVFDVISIKRRVAADEASLRMNLSSVIAFSGGSGRFCLKIEPKK